MFSKTCARLDAWSRIQKEGEGVENRCDCVRGRAVQVREGANCTHSPSAHKRRCSRKLQRQGKENVSVTASALQTMDEQQDNTFDEEIIRDASAVIYSGAPNPRFLMPIAF